MEATATKTFMNDEAIFTISNFEWSRARKRFNVRRAKENESILLFPYIQHVYDTITACTAVEITNGN